MGPSCQLGATSIAVQVVQKQGTKVLNLFGMKVHINNLESEAGY